MSHKLLNGHKDYQSQKYRRVDSTSLANHVLPLSSQVSSMATSTALSNRALYPYFFRCVPTESLFNLARMAIIRTYGWRRLAIIYEQYDIFALVFFSVNHQ